MKHHRAVLTAATVGLIAALAWPAYAYIGASAEPSTTVTALHLAAPGSEYTSTATSVTWQLSADLANPEATRYTVLRGSTAVCELDHHAGSCPEDAIPTGPASSVSYSVAAELGTAWASAQTVQAYTKPPTPTVTLHTGSDTGIKGDATTNLTSPIVSLSAPAGASSYTVQLYKRNLPSGSPTAVLGTPKTVQASTDLTIDMPILLGPNGNFEISAVATFHGLTSSTTPVVVHVVSGVAHVTALSVTNGGTDGTVDNGDAIHLSYDRAITPQSICGDWGTAPGTAYSLDNAVSVQFQPETWSGGGLPHTEATLSPLPDTCDDGGSNVINLGTLHLALVSGECTFDQSTLAISPDWKDVTLTLDGEDAGTSSCLTIPLFLPPTFGSANPKHTDYAGNSVDRAAVEALEFGF